MKYLLTLLIMLSFNIAMADDLTIEQEIEEIEMLFEGRELAETAPAPFDDSEIKRKLKDGTVQEFDGDKYMIVRRGKSKRKPKVIKEDHTRKSRVNLLVGYGPLGNIKEKTNKARTENDVILGLQFSRDFGKDTNGLIQVQSNESILFGIGVTFK